jgi:hypothetical protein
MEMLKVTACDQPAAAIIFCCLPFEPFAKQLVEAEK